MGGRPDSIVVDRYAGRNDVIFRDLATGKVRFIDGNTLALAAEEIYLPTWGFETWMAYDRYHHQTYALQVVNQEGWKEVLVHRVGYRSRLGDFYASVNHFFKARHGNIPTTQTTNKTNYLWLLIFIV